MSDYITDTVLGGDDAGFERMLDQFLKQLGDVDKKLSLDTQKKILRDATAPAVKSLRSRTRSAYKKGTGRAAKSVKTSTKNSKSRPGLAFTTYGWRNKGIQPIKYINRKGRLRERPKPATYIGIWGDLGTVKQAGKHILESEWAAQKTQIQNRITQAILQQIRDGFH